MHDEGAIAAPAPRGLDRTLTVTADDVRLPRLLRRALDDLDALLLTDPGRPDLFAAAGAPWYVTLFGRDSLWTASMLLPVDVSLAGGTLRTLARVQGRRTPIRVRARSRARSRTSAAADRPTTGRSAPR